MIAYDTCREGEARRTHPQDRTAVIDVVGRTSLICEVTGKSQRERQMEETPPDTVNPSISIESRFAALQSKLEASGKLRRSKPKTMPEHARLPHKND